MMKSVCLPDEGIESLYGIHDENLKLLEEDLKIHISARGNRLIVDGDERGVLMAEKILKEFSHLIAEGYTIRNGDFKVAIRLLRDNMAVSLEDFFLKTRIYASDKKQVTPKSFNQKKYIEAIREYDIVFSIGPAGTGKTYLAVAMAVAALNNKTVSRIILTRPALEAGEKLGFLPGDIAQKVDPFIKPLYDALHDLMTPDKVHRLLERGRIEIAPIGFMRGRTISDAFIIIDEAQNTTTEQMKMLLTRVGLNSKVVITGDITQIDLPPGKKSGLKEAIKILAEIKGIAFVYFDRGDVVRHKLVQEIIQAYESYSQQEEPKK